MHRAATAAAAHRPVPLGCRRAGHFLLKESWPKKHPPTSRPLRGFAAACGARRSPSLACGARACLGSRIVRLPSHPALGSCRGRSAPRGLLTAGRKRVASPLALALRADPSGVRRAEGGEKPKAKAQRPPSGAEDQEIGIGTIHPWDGISGPALHGRAFADCARAPLAAVRRRPKGPQEGPPFFGPFLWRRTAPQERREPRSGPRRGGGQDARSKERGSLGGSRAEPGGVPMTPPTSDTSPRGPSARFGRPRVMRGFSPPPRLGRDKNQARREDLTARLRSAPADAEHDFRQGGPGNSRPQAAAG